MMRIYHTSSTLERFVRLLDRPEEVNAVREMVDDTISQIQANQTLGCSPAVLSAGLHSDADVYLAKAMQTNPEASKITCRQGCAHCCRQLVAVVSCEAEELLAVAQDQQIEIDYQRLVRQSRCRTPMEWVGLAEPDRDCVFLKDNQCQVYEHRPLSCRKYFVTSDPKDCDIGVNPGGEVPVLFNLTVEILTTAAMTACGSEFMPQLLLDAAARLTIPTMKENQP